MIDRKDFTKLLFEKGKKAGIEDMEVFIQRSSELSLMVFKGEIDKYSKAVEEGLSFRGIYDGKMGYSYTEKIDETSIDILIEGVVSNAEVIDSDDKESIFEGSDKYQEVEIFNEDFEKVSTEEKIKFAKDLEEQAFKIDDRVDSVNYCLYAEETQHIMLMNTKGVDLEEKSNIAYAYLSTVLKEDGDVKTAGKYVVANDFNKFEAKKLAKQSVEEASSMLGAKSIKTNDYPIILRNDVTASILEAFVPIFTAERVQKDMSLLKGKINESIANDIITIIDDPFIKHSGGSRSFDDEGVATKFKKIIDKGVLKTFLHNTKTAKKDGIESTGNAIKPSYKASLSIAPTNMFIENGDTSIDELLSGIDKGVFIISVQGLHSGLDTVSGDFSLSAHGYEIEKGKIGRPVNQITIAGNFFEMLKEVEAIGDDLKFKLPSQGNIGAPSLKIKKLSVSGE